MGNPEMVVKRARRCSSRFTPVGAPMGFSAPFSSDGKRVFSAHFFSESEGWRFSVISEIGFSEIEETFFPDFSDISNYFDDRSAACDEQERRKTARSVSSATLNHEGHEVTRRKMITGMRFVNRARLILLPMKCCCIP